MKVFLFLLFLNWLIGCIVYYMKNKELTLFIILFSFIMGYFVFVMYFILEPLTNFFERLDNIKILKKKKK